MQLLAASLVIVFVSQVLTQNLQPHLTPNGVGTSHCRSCDENALCEYRGDNDDGQPKFQCVCKPAYSGNGINCNEVDPCAAGLDNCDSNAACKWISGSAYTCTCNAGFAGDGQTCQDVDECLTPNRCDPTNSDCVNAIGTFECVCKPGYVHSTNADGSVDMSSCVDQDECSMAQFQCPLNSVCKNSVGSYSCDCKDGYVKSSNNLFCVELDECKQTTPHPCDQSKSTCHNIPGGYECRCLPGYQWNAELGGNVNCYDINECADARLNNCPANSACQNTVGSYECKCNSGYQQTQDGLYCLDIDECSASISPCDLTRSVCTNTPGGFECPCNSGFAHTTSLKKICADIDECAEGLSNCNKYATCENEIGTFKCTCFYGYVGDGVQCVEASPSLSQLEASIANLSSTQLYLKLHTAYYENLHLKTELERYRRLCPLKKAGLLPTGTRAKRDLESDLNALTSGAIDEQRFKLQTLLHANSEISLQITILKRECGL